MGISYWASVVALSVAMALAPVPDPSTGRGPGPSDSQRRDPSTGSIQVRVDVEWRVALEALVAVGGSTTNRFQPALSSHLTVGPASDHME